MRTFTLFALLCTLAARPAHAEVLITEVYYCHGPVDDRFEWIELFNQSVVDVSLDGYRLAHGGQDYTWTVVEFGPDDVIPACGTFVVGGPNSVAENAFPIFDKAIDLDQDLQNGGPTADGVALFAPGEPLTGIPLDTVFWGEDNDFQLLGADGQPAVVNVAAVPDFGISISRIDEAGAWDITTPNPNTIGYLPEICKPIDAELRTWGDVKDDYVDDRE